jgi:sugar lactone lactonase YvrE
MPNIGSRALTRAFAGIAALAVILGSGQAVGAGKSRLRWVRSIYIDAKGGGLKHPEGLACGDDFLVVADTGNERLLRYSYQGDSVTADGELLLPKSHPIRVQVNSKGDVYYLDGRERRIVVIDATGEDKGALKPKSLPFSTQMVAKSFAIARNDDIYVLDVFSAQVLVLDAAGQYLRHVPFPKTYGFFSDLAVDAQGTIFILDGIEAAVYSAARGADSFSQFTESMKDVMNFPTSLSVDRSGILYLVDQARTVNFWGESSGWAGTRAACTIPRRFASAGMGISSSRTATTIACSYSHSVNVDPMPAAKGIASVHPSGPRRGSPRPPR